MNEEAHYKLLKLLEHNPQASQRDLARELDMSLGKVNYCLKSLIDKGLVKAENFRNSQNKAAYLYLLTPKGIKAKAKISVRYLDRKLAEYDALKTEIEQLEWEIGQRSE
jgi:EPS-associated MarR family transcriptional regulator